MIDLESTIEKIVTNENAQLYDIELIKEGDGYIYRVSITSQEGVSLDLCAKISNLISPILDTNPPTNANYFLEVSSPGVERKLKSISHMKSALDSLIKFRYNGDKMKGKLVDIDGNDISIMIKNETKVFQFDELSKIKTYIEW
jgi:ribosome maturation factor RimP